MKSNCDKCGEPTTFAIQIIRAPATKEWWCVWCIRKVLLISPIGEF